MYGVFVKLVLKEQFRDTFLRIAIANARSSLNDEEGCISFNVVSDEVNPNILYLLEVYRDKEAFQAHRKSVHFLEYQGAQSADWFSIPVERFFWTNVFPPDSSLISSSKKEFTE